EKVIYFFGDGAEKCKTILAHHPNAIFVDDVFPSASSMISMAEEKFRNKDFENVALFEPFYLKEFAAGKKII
ncbi:MAG: tRNA (adenosine(37)-N6)-threonylcarbamoyltransferase complex dimerization subunit type 1 TsaB, partial [Bacteroidetes bacterium]|nr:tRNA (adenosine(37)-N6)-threonylcarbamoyltransferase complex dimerization subunit type 1 TsaB [Bacteroidota bacterium]